MSRAHVKRSKCGRQSTFTKSQSPAECLGVTSSQRCNTTYGEGNYIDMFFIWPVLKCRFCSHKGTAHLRGREVRSKAGKIYSYSQTSPPIFLCANLPPSTQSSGFTACSTLHQNGTVDCKAEESFNPRCLESRIAEVTVSLASEDLSFSSLFFQFSNYF